MEYADAAVAEKALADSSLPAADLAIIAYRYPALRLAVARHPKTYSDLLNWLASQGDAEVAAAVEARRHTITATVEPAAAMPIGASVQWATAKERTAPVPTPPKRDQVFMIGRERDNKYVINDVLASRHHAELMVSSDGTMVLNDRGSLNGTQVNGSPITKVILAEGDVVTIGNTDLVVRGQKLEPHHSLVANPGELVVSGVDYRVPSGLRLLRGIELRAAPGTLTALIGPSGAGKSTLGRLLTGLTSPSAGQVIFAGQDLHANYAALRSRIGFVPQDDVVHTHLTVRQALSYTAELRLPADTSPAERKRVCDSVMAELSLSDRADLRIDKLSGGQRKRVSVAIELITSPTLLVLDEPTSGLDPSLDHQVMEMLHDLAKGGRIVIVVTHSLSYLSLTDQVLLLAPGGLPAYLGKPDGIQAAYGTKDWASVFDLVVKDPNEQWQAYLHRSGKTAAQIAKIERDIPSQTRVLSGTPPLQKAPTDAQRREGWRQTLTLIRRQVRLVIADVGYSVFLMVLPVALAVLAMVVPGGHGFSVPPPLDVGQQPSTEPNQLLMVLVLGACFMGASLTVRDLIGERPIFFRERSAGLSAGAYMISKLAVFAAASLIQSVVLVSILLIAKSHPGSGAFFGSGSFELIVDVAVLAICSMALGLLLSALARSSDQVMPMLVVVTMAQLVMSGGLVPVTGRTGLSQIAVLFPSRWGFAAGASTIDLRTLLGPVAQKDDLWNHTAGHWVMSIGILLAMTAVMTFIAYMKLRLPQKKRA